MSPDRGPGSLTRRAALLRLGLSLGGQVLGGQVLGGQALGLAATGRAVARERTEAVTVSTDIEALGRLIRLPARPQEAWWQTQALGEAGGLGPSDWLLVAVLRFAPDAARPLLAGAAQTQLPPGDFPDWALARVLGGGPGESEARACAIDPFAKPPLLDGACFHLAGADLFLLRLHTT